MPFFDYKAVLCGKCDRKKKRSSIIAACGDFSFVRIYNRIDNREADAKSTGFLVAGFVGAVKALEQFVVPADRNGIRGIPHLKDEIAPCIVERKADLSIVCGILDGIVQKQ